MDEFLKEAEEAYGYGLYAASLVMSHAAVRLKLASRLRREDGSLRDLAQQAYRDGLDVDVKGLGKLSWIRNRVMHEGYTPKKEEARWAIGVATKSLDVMTSKGVLRQLVRRLGF